MPIENLPGLEIRRAGAADVGALTELNRHVQTLHVARRPDVFTAWSSDAVGAWLEERLALPQSRAWIAEASDAAVGYLLLVYHSRGETPFAKAREFAEIDQVGVHPDYRRRGVGRALVEEAIVNVRFAGLGAVELSTWAFNDDAQHFFTRHGFAPMTARWQRLL